MLLESVILPLLCAAAPPDAAGESPLPAGAFARLGTGRLKHATVISTLAVLPDGKGLLTASHSGVVCCWDSEAGRLTRRLESVGNVVAVSPDGKRLASSSHGAQITLRDAASGKPTHVLNGHTGQVVGLAFAPDGKSVYSAGRDRTLRMWDSRSVKLLWSYTVPGEINALAVSRDGRRLAASAEDRKVHLWDASGANHSALPGHTAKVTCVAFSPDGHSLVSGGWDTTARVWDLASGKQTRLIRHQSGLEAVAFSPDGKKLAAIGGAEHAVYLWDLSTPKEKLLWKGRQMHGLRLEFTGDGKTLVSTGWDNTVRLWDVATGKRRPADLGEGHEGWVYAVVPLAGGKEVISTGSDGQVLLWDAGRRSVVRRFVGHTSRVWCLALSPDGRTLASGGSDQTVRIWELSSGKEIRKIAAQGHVKGLAFSPDGRRLASAVGETRYPTWMGPTPGSSAKVWDLATGQPALDLAGHDSGVKAVAFAPDGRSLATGGNDGFVRVWDAASGKERLRAGVPGAVEAVAFSPDGEHLAATGQDQKVRLIQSATGEVVLEAEGPRGWGVGLAFSPDGRTLAVAAQQDVSFTAAGRVTGPAVRVWEVATGRERWRFAGHQETAHAVAFSPDGRTLLTGGADGCVLLWDLTGGGAKLATVEKAWADLVNEADAGRSVWALAARPAEALPLLRGLLKPVARVDAARVARLIEQLDDDAFAVRQKATEELEEVGEPAAKALREAAKEGTIEVRTRAGRLLERLAGKGEGLRSRRAMEVLEYAEGAGAEELLRELAKGDPDARRTKEAKAALRRRALHKLYTTGDQP